MAAEPRVPPASLVHRGLGRVEFFDLAADEVARLGATVAAHAREGRGRFSFHAPIVRPAYFPASGVTAYFLCEDPARRALSFRLLDDTLARAARCGADYVVCHLTFGATDTRDERAAVALARRACARLAAMSRTYGVRVDVEFAAYSHGFHRAELFVDAVTPHAELGICLDVGHAYLGALARGRDYLADVRTLAPATRSMHLWNTRGPGHTAAWGHTPLHPRQRPADGWIDVERTLATCLGARGAVDVVFEYPADDPRVDVEEGYAWIASVVGRFA
jgi:sugar phosphate isomerase/epimerase